MAHPVDDTDVAGDDASHGRAASVDRPAWRRVLRRIGIGCVVVVLLLILALLGAYALPPQTAAEWGRPLLGELTDAPPLPDELPTPDRRTLIHDRHGTPFAVLAGVEDRVSVPFESVPDHLVDAVLAAEDADFYAHGGIDHRGIMRAALTNVVSGAVEQGGSTITQQLVKNTLLSTDVTLDRKIHEAWYALQVEDRYSKDTILERYLNELYLGNGVYGVGLAAQRYFGVSVDQLDVGQAALLAGLIAAPERTDPLTEPERAREQRDLVLNRMVAEGLLEPARRDELVREPLRLDPQPPAEHPFPFLVDLVMHALEQRPELGDGVEERRARVFTGGLSVHTTLDLRLQQLARDAIDEVLTAPAADPQAVVVTVEVATGAVRAVGVGPDEHGDCSAPQRRRCTRTRVNPAVEGMGGSGRQPGSAFKPLVDAAALSRGVPIGLELDTPSGEPVPGCRDGDEPYTPTNYGDVDGGVIAMPEALRISSNVYHARLTGLIGAEAVIETATDLGLDAEGLPQGCSIALGAGSVYPLRMAQAYAAVAGGGVTCDPYVVTRVETPDGATVMDAAPDCSRALSAGVAEVMLGLLRLPLESGTAVDARIGRPAAAKTGTTDDNRDAWLVGVVPQLATAVWIGYEEPAPLVDLHGVDEVTGGTLPAELWAAYMRPAVEPLPVEPLPPVPTPEQVELPAVVGMLLDEAQQSLEPFTLLLEPSLVRDHRPRGTILQQRPEAGAVVARGSRVAVDVSDGRGEPPVPDVPAPTPPAPDEPRPTQPADDGPAGPPPDDPTAPPDGSLPPPPTVPEPDSSATPPATAPAR